MRQITEKAKRSLKFSLYDGVFASAMIGFTQDYFAPFLILLKATARQIGMLSALPNLAASLVQLISAEITEKLKSRRLVINIFVFLQAVMMIPMAFAAFKGDAEVNIFIIFATLFTSFGAFITPAWGSLMSDLVPESKRGAYFGWRNKVLGFIIVGTTFMAGFILNVMKKINVFNGFFIIFASAFLFRLISWYFLTRMYEPSLTYKEEHHFTMFDFLRRIRKSNFGRFVIFVSLMSFSVNLGSPFFSVLMLRDLHFSYLIYTVVILTAPLTIYLLMSRWGAHADRFGNIKIIRFSAPLIGIIPIFWILNRHPVFLIFAQVFSGFTWAAFNLCTTNFIYDAVTTEKRVRCIAYFNVFNGLAICAGALLGGFLLKWLPPLFGYNILTLLAISSILRLIVGCFGPTTFKEVKLVEHINGNSLFFSVIGIKPILGIDRKEIRY